MIGKHNMQQPTVQTASILKGRQGGTAAADYHGGVRGGGEAQSRAAADLSLLRAAADLSLLRTADQNGAADGAGRRGLQRRGRRRGEAWTAEVGKQSRGGPERHGGQRREARRMSG